CFFSFLLFFLFFFFFFFYCCFYFFFFFFFSSRRRHTRYWRDWSSDVCSSDLDRHQHQRQRLRCPQIRLHRRVDGERHRLRAAGEVAGEEQRGAEFAHRPCPAHRRPRDEPWRCRWQAHADEGAERRRAERARDDEEVLVHPAEGGDRGLDEERRGHEGLGEDDRRRGEDQGDPVALQKRAQQPPPAKGEQQADARHGGRNHRRDLRDRLQPAGEAAGVARHPPGEQRSQPDHQGQAGGGGQEREAQRRPQQGIAQAAEKIAPAQRAEEREHGQEQERSQEHRGEGLRRAPGGGPALLHFLPTVRKPKRANFSCPGAERRRSTNSRASAGCFARVRTATGYSATTFTPSGSGMTCTSDPAAAASVR